MNHQGVWGEDGRDFGTENVKSKRKKKTSEFLGLIWRNVWNGTAASTHSDKSRLETWMSVDAAPGIGCSCGAHMVDSSGGN